VVLKEPKLRGLPLFTSPSIRSLASSNPEPSPPFGLLDKVPSNTAHSAE